MIECCAELAQMTRNAYHSKTWSTALGTINQWGRSRPLRFLLIGYPIAAPTPGRPDLGPPRRTACPRPPAHDERSTSRKLVA
jgi:hypothetical protein